MAFVNVAAAVRPALSRPSLCRTAFVTRSAVAAAPAKRAAVTMLDNIQPAFTKAMADYNDEFAPFAKRGWGATTKAEVWNGRHAMFGWLMIIGTAEARNHGLMPSGNLDLAQWGALGTLGDGSPISLERAAIIVAHIHFLFVSVAAALAPFSFQDKLLLEEGEADASPAGLFPDFAPGLNRQAELWNGRVAMVGLITTIAISAATGTSFLDTVNAGLGGKLF